MEPLCSYAQTTCLEPYRHDVENNVSVPISASEGFLHRLRKQRIGTTDNSRATPQSGDKTQTTSLSPYSVVKPLVIGLSLGKRYQPKFRFEGFRAGDQEV
ncbi:MAG: hypothetical protein GX456_03035 [Verrucomicrobia bacterium]|nr:hypothetical protein [Verrucomicrobiota bacterium]